MAIRFNADEVFTVAEQIERNGATFYRCAAEMQADPRAKEMLLVMAAMEEQHERAFQGMHAQLTQDEREAVTFDADGELPLYLRALADRTVFDVTGDCAARLTGRESVSDVCRMGVSAEKDSVVFYLGMRDLVPGRLGTEKIDAIIKEEMGHISTLAALAQRLAG